MPSVLVTGSNRGIGLEFVRQYAAEGWRVHATCRRPEAADALNALSGDIAVHRLDVTDEAARAALADALSGEALDLLLNNAGIYGSRQDFGAIDHDGWARVLEVNAIAPIALAERFLPHLARGKGRKIAFITSQMGSIADNGSGGYYAYRSSKAALNAAVRSLAIDLAPRGIVAVLLHPGWVRTDMGGPNARLDPETSVANMRRMIERAGPRQSGRFLAHDGRELPW